MKRVDLPGAEEIETAGWEGLDAVWIDRMRWCNAWVVFGQGPRGASYDMLAENRATRL